VYSTTSNVFFIAVMAVLLPIMGESIYAPALPSLASDFGISESLAEQSFAVYLFGTACGVFFWGQLSDFVGRKKSFFYGLVVFSSASLGCAIVTSSYVFFLVLRFLQAFGGGVSVLGQTINRDVFSPEDCMRFSSTIGTVVSLAPALGALLGACIVEYMHWRVTFLFLSVIGVALHGWIRCTYQETKKDRYLQADDAWALCALPTVFQSRFFRVHTLLIGLGLGIFYALMTEGSFYFIKRLLCSKFFFSTVVAACATVYAIGCYWQRTVERYASVQTQILLGLLLMLIGLVWVLLVLVVCDQNGAMQFALLPWLLAAGLMCCCFGLSFVLTPSFALALSEQHGRLGVAASWFALTHNLINSGVNFGMNALHSESLFTMPLYFLAVVVCMFFVYVKNNQFEGRQIGSDYLGDSA
jgi:MFS family permease